MSWRASGLLALWVALPSAAAETTTETFIQISTPVSGARIFIDGTPEGAKTNVPIAVEPGTHEITIESDGHATYKRWVTAEAGQTTLVHVDLLPIASETPAPRTDVVTRAPQLSPPPAWYEQWWVWGVVGAAVVGGVALGIAAASSGDDFVPGGELGRSSTRDWTGP
jgi:hypothetical protein